MASPATRMAIDRTSGSAHCASTHLGPVELEPRQVLDIRTGRKTLEEAPPMQHRMLLAEGDQPARELEQVTLLVVQIPIEPADLVVLAVGVVVPCWVRPISSPASSVGTP